MDQSQILYVTVLLQAGLLQQVPTNVNLEQGNWDVILPYLAAQHLEGLAGQGLAFLKSKDAATVQPKVFAQLGMNGIKDTMAYTRCSTDITKFSRVWNAAGKQVLALGGLALAPLYPSPNARGGNELVCVPLYKKDATADERNVKIESPFDFGSLRIVVPETAAATADAKHRAAHDAVLNAAFASAPCTIDARQLTLRPNYMFWALYHLQLTHSAAMSGQFTLISAIDWAMLLRRISAADTQFDWAAFRQQAAALGVTRFATSLTTLAVRLTGIQLPADALGDTDDKGADLLLASTFATTGSAAASGVKGFVEVLRNHDFYAHNSDGSVIGRAFSKLFA